MTIARRAGKANFFIKPRNKIFVNPSARLFAIPVSLSDRKSKKYFAATTPSAVTKTAKRLTIFNH
jgi:hypothetical protein